MPPSFVHTIRTATHADVERIAKLRTTVGWGEATASLEAVVNAGGLLVTMADESGELIATGGGIVFKPLGWVLNMVVRPDHQGRGLGRMIFEHIIEWLRDQGVQRIELEATVFGRPLYEQYGFVSQWESCKVVIDGPRSATPDAAIRLLQTGDWPEVLALDAVATGGDRSAYLREVAANRDARESLVLREDGRLVGFGMRSRGMIGPVIAADSASAVRLASALLVEAAEGDIVQVGRPEAAGPWESLGFTVLPSNVRMTFGPDAGAQPDKVFAMYSAGVG